MTRATDRGTKAHFHGNLRCACWYACPVCSAALRRERAADVVRCVGWWRGGGGVVELLTLTFAHGVGDDLKSLNAMRQAAWRKLFAGAPGKRLKAALGVEHYVRGTDDTHGERNGWHPHFHVVLFTKPDARTRSRATAELRARWHACVLKVLGRHHVPSWSRGADLRECRNDEYIAKLGLELVSSQTKTATAGSRTPWEIARAAARADDAALTLWRTYCGAMKGVRQLVWSRHVRKAAALGTEKTDEEIVAAIDNDAEETHVASIPARIFDDVARMPGALLAVLRAAETGGRMGVANAIALYAWGLAPPDPGADPDQLVLELFNSIAPVEPDRTAAAA